ncbi:MAG: 5'/3'-nucleotidase SurE [Elusimicrobiota bacterium]|jgi:5'-nucleotidase|nr:5'/3'-nucleotidase SurE [Elusimicrobiota bacterium]
MPKILISNDDGIKGEGLQPLIKELSKIASVFTVVPEEQMSGTSCSITLSEQKKACKVAKDFYVLKNGSPVDCVKFGLHMLQNEVDLLVSGINNCPNMGHDVIYSGTVGAAREGAAKGIASIAVSAAEMFCKEYDELAKATSQIALNILKNKKKFKNSFLNINIPKNYKGIKVVPLGTNGYNDSVETSIDKEGNFYYKLTGRYFSGGDNKGCDVYFCEKGYITITPLSVGQTDFVCLPKMKKFFQKNTEKLAKMEKFLMKLKAQN